MEAGDKWTETASQDHLFYVNAQVCPEETYLAEGVFQVKDMV